MDSRGGRGSGGDELEAGGKIDEAARSGNAHPTVLERLTEGFEDVLPELRQFVEERDTPIRCKGYRR